VLLPEDIIPEDIDDEPTPNVSLFVVTVRARRIDLVSHGESDFRFPVRDYVQFARSA
jgi:hypothetical protein